MTTDTHPKESVVARPRLHRRRHGEGLGDDPSQPRDDARGRHHRLSARAGRGDRVPPPRGRRELQRHLGRRRVLDERHRAAARERRERHARASDEAFAAALRTVCGDLAKQIVADGEGATVLAEIAVRGAASDGEARAIAERVATSPLVKTALYGHDANWGRIAAAAGSAKLERRLSRSSIPTCSRSPSTACPCSCAACPSGDEPVLTNGHCAIEIDLALGEGVASYLTTRPLLRLRAHQRGVPLVSVVLKVGGASHRRHGRRRARAAHARPLRRASCTAPARRSPRRWSAAGSRSRSSDGRRVTTRGRARRRARELRRRQRRRSAPRSAPTRSPLAGDEVGLEAEQVPELGLVGQPVPSRPPAVVAALADGPRPGRLAARARAR